MARSKPDFLIIGASKCGTTSLYSYLTSHPQIASARSKEIHYFDTGFHRGSAWYRSHFPLRSLLHQSKGAHARVLTGEASPYYIFHPHALRRISKALPQILMIIILRNPVDRAYSHYNHTVRLGYETLSFEEAIAAEDGRLNGEVEKILADESYYSFNHQYYSYLTRGIYADQLLRLRELGFAPEQVLILKSECFFARPADCLPKLWQFLQLADCPPRNLVKLNKASYEEMATETRHRLSKFYEPHNQRLDELVGRAFNW